MTSEDAETWAGDRSVRGDLTTGDGLDEAIDAIDVIAHLASGTSGVPSYTNAKPTLRSRLPG